MEIGDWKIHVSKVRKFQKSKAEHLKFTEHKKLSENSHWAWNYIDLKKLSFFSRNPSIFLEIPGWPKIWQWCIYRIWKNVFFPPPTSSILDISELKRSSLAPARWAEGFGNSCRNKSFLAYLETFRLLKINFSLQCESGTLRHKKSEVNPTLGCRDQFTQSH